MAFTLTPSKPVSGAKLFTYETVDSADTPSAVLLDGTSPVVGFLQVSGTFGGATAKVQISNDNTNWVDVKDLSGTAIAITEAGGAEFSTAAIYVRPLVTGGSGTALTISLAFRG
jgi:hypothetical protein